ncbi:hypothetical protein [Persephonella sp.]
MIVLTGDTRAKKFVNLLKQLNWGRMFIDTKIRPYEGEPWGFDNGAFRDWKNGREFDEDRFLKSLDRALKISEETHPPYLAVIPDIVAGGSKSLDFSTKWYERLKDINFPWYLAVQDGMNEKDVEDFIRIYKVAGIFLGGTDRFKMTAVKWSRLAKKYGMKFHYARAGTPRKYSLAKIAEADSIDSAFPLWVKDRLDYFIKNAEKYYQLMKSQKNLFDFVQEDLN